jgi:hypothetical protein
MNIQFTKSSYTNLFKHPAMGISLHNWIILLFKVRFNIYIGFLPKALFLTGMIVFNTPFHLYEYFIYSSKIKRVKLKSPVFVLGHPRSGTTYLNNILSKDPVFSFSSTYDVLTPHVFLTLGKGFKNMLKKALPSTRPQDNVKMTIDSPKEEEFAMANMSQASYIHGFFFPKRIMKIFNESVLFTEGNYSNHWKKKYDYFLKKLAFKYNNNQLLLKSPANTARIKEIVELYPDAKFIHIYRNPYDVYRSTERLYEKILPITSFQKVDNPKMEKYIIEAYSKMYQKYFKDRKDIPSNQLFEVSYETFVKEPLATIEKAYTHLGLRSFKEAEELFLREVKDVVSYQKNKYTSIPKSIKEKINVDWKFAFDEFEYELE